MNQTRELVVILDRPLTNLAPSVLDQQQAWWITTQTTRDARRARRQRWADRLLDFTTAAHGMTRGLW